MIKLAGKEIHRVGAGIKKEYLNLEPLWQQIEA